MISPALSNRVSFADLLKTHLRNFWTHFKVQAPKEFLILKKRWLLIIACLLVQYIHNIFTNVVYYLHQQRPVLKDLGFEAIPHINPQYSWISEVLFSLLFTTGIFTAIVPLIRPCKYTSVDALSRGCLTMALATLLRICCFMGTILPSPNYHCRPGSPTYDPPKTAWEMFSRIDATTGCGDLIFSSHLLLSTVFTLSINKYCPSVKARILGWVLLPMMAIMVISARKHYTVDIVVALYTVPLLWFFLEHKLMDLGPDSKRKAIPAFLRQRKGYIGLSEGKSSIEIPSGFFVDSVDMPSATRENATSLPTCSHPSIALSSITIDSSVNTRTETEDHSVSGGSVKKGSLSAPPLGASPGEFNGHEYEVHISSLSSPSLQAAATAADSLQLQPITRSSSSSANPEDPEVKF
eukprot:GCRY01002780.1.p1 GENE.GCRY01002780.1~~GCRY01002780.1.p1  ORF type:complete len:408 (-),score=10.46 GCRY01002780.1:493-1716(-)